MIKNDDSNSIPILVGYDGNVVNSMALFSSIYKQVKEAMEILEGMSKDRWYSMKIVTYMQK